MTCAPLTATFRLLDATVGWDEAAVLNVVGFTDPKGVRLANAGRSPDGPTRNQLLPWFPDPRLAPGCQPCAWYLIAGTRLLRRDTCTGGWRPVWDPRCDPHLLRAPVSVAARGHRVAVVDSGRVLVWRNEGEQLTAVIRVRRARLVALAPDDQVLVVRAGSTDLWRFGTGAGAKERAPSGLRSARRRVSAEHVTREDGGLADERSDPFNSDGRPLGVLRTGISGEIIGVRTGPGRTIWLLTDDGGRLQIYRGHPFRESTLDELTAALAPSTLVSAGEDGFCLKEKGLDGDVTTCYTWQGKPRPEPAVPRSGQYVTDGEFTTSLIDSGISRCRWHRVRVDADVPAGTAVAVAIVVSEDGRYADTDWQQAPPGVTDFLVDQPPGRFLTARVRLSGDTSATPVLRRIRLDFPRTTSADLLPAAFRQDPAADDFTERFLSLFDATFAEIDRVIERYPALLDPAGSPDQALPWLAGLLGLSFEAGWDAATRRALIAAAPALYRRRGTPWALAEAVRIIFGVTPVLDELATDRRWAHTGAGAKERLPSGLRSARRRVSAEHVTREDGGLADERERPINTARGLGSVRLFGRSASRFRIGGSALGAAPLRAFGDPDIDPLTEHAHRFRVLLPAGSADQDALRRLVERQVPAHTRGSVRTGGAGFVVGTRSTVGVDTAFVPLPAPVLGGARPLLLNQDGVLRPGPRGARHGVNVGVASAVGVHTRVS